MSEGHGQVADRFIQAQSWWLGSELVSRSPQLFLYEYHPGGGQYDCLGVVDDRHPERGAVIDLNRAGSLHVHQPAARRAGAWADVIAQDDPHAMVKRLERLARLTPTPRPVTTRRALTYRVVAHVLRATVDDRHHWEARSAHLDSAGDDDSSGRDRHVWMADFEGARRAAGELPAAGWFGEPWSHTWLILRGGEPVAALLDDAHVFRIGGDPVDLMTGYRKAGRVAPVVAAAFEGLLA